MSERHLELVRRGHEAYNARDLDAAVAGFADDARWRLIGGFADLMGAEFEGRDAIRRFFTEWLEILGGEVYVESVQPAGERVVAVVRTRATGAASGVPAEMRWGQVFTFRGDEVLVVDNYYEVDDALQAVGLEPEASQS